MVGRTSGWERISPWFAQYEVAQKFWAKIKPWLAYIGSKILDDPYPCWWTVVLTNCTVEVSTREISETFVTWRL